MKIPFHPLYFIILFLSSISIYDTSNNIANSSEENKNNNNTINNDNDKNKDLDDDGLTDIEETNIYKTDPKNPDTDQDRIIDGKEVKGWIWAVIENTGFCNTLSSNIIPENSDLKNLCIIQKTNPLLSDTDSDGNDDFFEYNFLLANALSPDQDKDALTDGLEIGPNANYQTSFLQFDTDGDGISDGAEVIARTNPLDPTDNPEAPELSMEQRLQNPLASLAIPPRSTGLNPPLVTPPNLLQIVPGNEPPRPLSQTITIPQNRPLQITLFATDPNGQDQLSFYIRSYPQLGHLQNQIVHVDRTTAKVLYTPDQNAKGRDVFTFWAFDGKAFSRDRGIITINIVGPDILRK
jgi:hypothetical protein